MAFQNRGKWIKAFQRMRLHRKYPPIVVRCVGFLFHDRILFFASPFALWETSQGKTVAHFRLSGHLANLRIVKIRNVGTGSAEKQGLLIEHLLMLSRRGRPY